MKKCINGLLRAKHLFINYFLIVSYVLNEKIYHISMLFLVDNYSQYVDTGLLYA